MDYALQTAAQLAGQLRALRRVSGISQKEMGERLGVGQSRVTRIEQDPRLVNFEQLLDYMSALGVQLVLRTRDEQEVVALPPAVSPAPRPASEEPW